MGLEERKKFEVPSDDEKVTDAERADRSSDQNYPGTGGGRRVEPKNPAE